MAKKGKKKKQSKGKKTNHHIIPSSRGGSDLPDNIARIDRYRHDLYHQLFVNKTPREILRFLYKKHWCGKGLRGHELALYNKLFNNRSPQEVINYLVSDFWKNQSRWIVGINL